MARTSRRGALRGAGGALARGLLAVLLSVAPACSQDPPLTVDADAAAEAGTREPTTPGAKAADAGDAGDRDGSADADAGQLSEDDPPLFLPAEVPKGIVPEDRLKNLFPSFFMEGNERLTKDGFVPLGDYSELPAGEVVRYETRQWLGRFLRPEVNPHVVGKEVRRSVHWATKKVALDALRHELTARVHDEPGRPDVELQVRITETAWRVVIEVLPAGRGLLPAPPNERLEAMTWLGLRVLARKGTHVALGGEDTPHTWVFRYPHLRERTHFVTDPLKLPDNMESWAARVDGGIWRDALYFVGYKKHTSERPYSVQEDHWFDGQALEIARKAEEERQRDRALAP